MAYYQSGIFTTANQLLIDLATFAAANGWTIDFDGVYNTSYRRLHLHQGEAHFDMHSTSATAIAMYGCTSYASGSAPSAQPAATTYSKPVNGVNGRGYWFVSTDGGLYVSTLNASNYFTWASLFIVSGKIGGWTNGFGIVGQGGAGIFTDICYSSARYGQLYYNGAWSTTVDAGGLAGTEINGGLAVAKQPNWYNNGIVPIPVALVLHAVADATKRVPMGFAPGLYLTNGGNRYDIGETLLIGSDTYIMLPRNDALIGSSSSGDYLFKLGN